MEEEKKDTKEQGLKLSYQAIFDGMDKLARHGFEYFLAGISALMLIAGIVGTPQRFLTQGELWAISVFGFAGLISSIYVWRQKAFFKLQSNQEKITYKKFKVDESIKKYGIVARRLIEKQKISEDSAQKRNVQATEALTRLYELEKEYFRDAEKAYGELEDIK